MFLRFLKFVSALVLAAVVIGVGVLSTFVVKWAREIPDYRQLDTLTLGSTTRVFARDNTPLGSLIPKIGEARVSRTLVTLDDVSPYMTAAIVANEDRRFFEHYGLDPYGLARQFRRLSQNEDVQGGSTLTNQLVKNTLLLDQYKQARTPERKVKEWMLSVQVERSFTKEEILQDYLNVIYWGDGGPVELYGLYAAAQAYFGATPKQLTLAQAAYLTTLVPNPSRYFDYAAQRPYVRTLLDRMVEDGWVSRAEADAAWRTPVQPKGWKVTYDQNGNVKSARLVDKTAKYLKAVTTVRAPHFMQQVEQELIRKLGRDRVYGAGGLIVYTTLDPQIQSSIEAASRNARGLPYGATLGATILDPYTGEVLGMVGQKLQGDQPPADWNNAAQGQRQVGSTIKPLLYTTALSTGLDELHREDDKPVSFPCSTCAGGRYEPQNFEGQTTYRNMTIREALDRSLNLVTVRLADRIGLPTFFGKLRELGLAPNDGTGLAAALGAIETTPVKMAAAYAPFVNGGTYRAPSYITRVTTTGGEVLYDSASEVNTAHRVWTPQIAWLGLDLLKGVVNDLTERQGGLATRAKIDTWTVGGKTGTSNGPKDFWFVGVTPYYVGAVWVGKQQGGLMPRTYYSGYVNAPIWQQMMAGALKGKTARNFAEPAGIRYVDHPDQGLMPNVKVALLDPRYRNAANTAVEPTPQVPTYREAGAPPLDSNTLIVTLDRRTNRLATEFTPPEEVVQRRVYVEDLPAYAPDPNPQPLKDEPASKPAVKANDDSGIPSAPVVTPASTGTP
ncbi:transglycosylase domain-containing protein [Deinococcus maricopensis]|uniref:peptidoglycan glycosyltransferase n=1 Tax=Deinococcus maricopensis (strain DSM 21211 / LMG 22137 / NRRL B-23946 / LB-34) TaxID=709986 RepID=E8U6M8_DEIML|nr:transglycosylase domain-containing protein [Deinococcus maricopensis]ADV66717.1 Peptidoglycan glycosyltransferase [Deinococcus maricopensis DSM 21211]